MANFNDLINLEGLTEYDSKIKEHIVEQVENGKVKLETSTTTAGYAKSYTLKTYSGETIGVIDIPKDMFVTDGRVVTNPEGQKEGIYVEFTIANNDGTKLYIDVSTLIVNYVVEQKATQIQLAIDEETRTISATLVAGGVTTDAIADGAVTKAKLDADVQEILDNVNTIIDSGECGAAEDDNVLWVLYSNGLLKISGNGGIKSGPILGNDYVEQIKEVMIEDGVTSIGTASFAACYNLTRVDIPHSVTTINTAAFNNCSSLKAINISNNVTLLASSAFAGCTNLTVYFYESLSLENAISSANSINNPKRYGEIYDFDLDCPVVATLPETVSRVVASGDCSSGSNVKWTLYSDGLLKISGVGSMPHYSKTTKSPWNNYIKQIREVNIENGITSIGNYAFNGCPSLASINMPNSVTKIGQNSFDGCTNLTSINIPNVTSIETYAFYGCSNLTVIDIPSITFMGQNAFAKCESLAYVNISSGVETISAYAFQYCRNLTHINIPNSVTAIGDYAFDNCTSLTKIYYYEASSEDDINCNIGSKSNDSSSTTFIDADKHYGEIYDPNFGCAVKTKIDDSAYAKTEDIPTVTVASTSQIDALFN